MLKCTVKISLCLLLKDKKIKIIFLLFIFVGFVLFSYNRKHLLIMELNVKVLYFSVHYYLFSINYI